MEPQDRLADKRFVERRAYNIKQVWDHHQRIIEQKVLGLSNTEIAEREGCTPQTVSNVCNSPLGIARRDELSSEIADRVVEMAERIREFAPECQDLIEDIVRGRVEGASLALRAKLATDAMSRAGYGVIQKVHAITHAVTKDDIEAFKQRQREAAIENGSIAVDYEET